MHLPIFPAIELAKNDDQVAENPLLETFLQQFIAQMRNEVLEMKICCESLKKSNENLQSTRDKYLREIFNLTHGNMNDGVLSQQLSQRLQIELEVIRMGGKRDDEVLVNFQKDYIKWRGTLESKMQTLLGNDELFELSQLELNAKLQVLKSDAESAERELNAFQETTKVNIELLEEQVRVLNEEVKSFDSLKLEMRTTQQRLTDKLNEEQLKRQQDTNKLLKEIAHLQKNLQLYE